MYRSQNLALKYFTAAITLFGVVTLSGLISACYYINPDFLFGLLPFSIAKILHIDTLVIGLLMAFMASIYWFLPEELGREPSEFGLLKYCSMYFVRQSRSSPSCLSLCNT